MKATVSYLLFATKTYHIKAKGSETKDFALCLGSIPKYFTINSIKKRE